MPSSSNATSMPPANDCDSKIVVAMDFDNIEACLNLANKLNPALCRLKIGKELFTLYGPKVVEAVQKQGFDVFLDLKFHDIPATVAKAVRAAANMGVWMVNVHVSGGTQMMIAAREALEAFEHKPLLIGVTVLTSMSQDELRSVGISSSLDEHVLLLAGMAKQSGLDGVVCSAQESLAIRGACGSEFVLVTPGIRPEGTDANDQHRIVTPVEAINKGSHYLVIGRPITQASNPVAVCEQIFQATQSVNLGNKYE